MLDALSKKHELNESARFLKLIDAFQNALLQVRLTVIPQLPLEVAIVSVCAAQSVEAISVPEKKAPSEEKPPTRKVVTETSKKDDLKGLKEIPVEVDENAPLELKDVQEKMPRVIEHIVTPAVKRSFLTGTLEKIEAKKVYFLFSTQFHMDKVTENDNRAEIEQAFKEVLGVTIKLEAGLKKVDLEPATYEKTEEKPSEVAKERDIADIAVDMFGGELIEE